MSESITKHKLSIFDPAMCCPTGMCGVSIDPEFLRVATALHSLKQSGIEVHRYNLSTTPQEFIINPIIKDYINQKGADELPITLLDDKIVLTKRYPCNQEMTDFLGLDVSILATQPHALNIKIR